MLRFLVLAGSFGAALACAAPPPAFTDVHAAAVRDSATVFLAEFRRLSTAAQWDSLGAVYSDRPDFRFLESGELRYTSADAVREALRLIPAGQRIETEYEDVLIQPVAPGVAIISARFTTRFVDRTTTLFSFGGAVSIVLHHEAAGWRIIGGHSSAPVARGRFSGATPN